MTEDAVTWWERALDTLHAAELLVQASPDNAASRAYYAVHHAVVAHFLLMGVTYEKHTALETAVHRDLVHPGPWPVDLGKDFSDLARLRSRADYGGQTRVSSVEAQEAVLKARRILQAVCRLHPDFLKWPGGKEGPKA